MSCKQLLSSCYSGLLGCITKLVFTIKSPQYLFLEVVFISTYQGYQSGGEDEETDVLGYSWEGMALCQHNLDSIK